MNDSKVNDFLKTPRGLKTLLYFGWGKPVTDVISKAPTFSLGCGLGPYYSLSKDFDIFDTLLDMVPGF